MRLSTQSVLNLVGIGCGIHADKLVLVLLVFVACRYLDAIGYSISTYGFSGPFINPEHIKDGSIKIEAWSLYCVRKDLRQAQLAKRAGVTAPKP